MKEYTKYIIIAAFWGLFGVTMIAKGINNLATEIVTNWNYFSIVWGVTASIVAMVLFDKGIHKYAEVVFE